MKAISISLSSIAATAFLASAVAQTESGNSIRVSGDIQPAAPIDIKPAVGGRVKKLHVRMGDQVKAGDLLIEIDTPLVEDSSKLKIFAPIAGTILTVPVSEGQPVVADVTASSTTLMTMSDLSRLVIDTHVPPAAVTKLTSKQAVQLTADSLRSEQMEATISFVSPIATIQNSGKGFGVRAVIEKPDPRLRPGMNVQLTIPILTPNAN